MNGNLIKRLDAVFSKFIRLRDANFLGLITCVSCRKQVLWSDANCCHYADRRHIATRWDEMNNHAGCVECNWHNKGFHIHEYGKFLEEQYGPGTCDNLVAASRVETKFTDSEIQEKINYYKQRIREYEKFEGEIIPREAHKY